MINQNNNNLNNKLYLINNQEQKLLKKYLTTSTHLLVTEPTNAISNSNFGMTVARKSI